MNIATFYSKRPNTFAHHSIVIGDLHNEKRNFNNM